MKTAIVIGSGIGGLAVAIRLANKGYAVRVYEKNEAVGGKLAEFKEGGFRFDMGPSLFTMPEYLEDLFAESGRPLKDYLTYTKLDRSCQYFFDDGSSFKFYHDQDRLKAEMDSELSEDFEALRAYLKKADRSFEGPGRLFIEHSLHRAKTYWSKQAIKALPQLLNPKNIATLHQHNQKWFTNPKWIKVFDRYATYNGSSPYQTSSMMAMIPHLEHNVGTFFPEGGMFAIVKALAKKAKDLGVDLMTHAHVDGIKIKGGKIRSVQVNGRDELADIFVSNMDVASFYKHLLKDERMLKRQLNLERSSSGLVFYWGMNRAFPKLDLHNIFFSAAYESEFKAIFEDKVMPESPTIYVNISSKLCPKDAPDGMENWFVMVNVPADVSISDQAIEAVRAAIIDTLSEHMGVSIADCIRIEKRLKPEDIASRTLALDGALYGAASHGVKSSFTRHSNFSKTFSNLYFVGGTVHPGGGIPLCLNSAKIVADRL